MTRYYLTSGRKYAYLRVNESGAIYVRKDGTAETRLGKFNADEYQEISEETALAILSGGNRVLHTAKFMHAVFATAGICCLVFIAGAQQGYTPRKEILGKTIPEMQVPNPSPLPERRVAMHTRYHNSVETNAWFTLYLGALNHRVYGIEPHETWIVTTVEPKVIYTNGTWITRF